MANNLKRIEIKGKKTYIGVKLSNKAGKIAVFEVFGEKGQGKGLRIPNDEAVVVSTPRDDMIGG